MPPDSIHYAIGAINSYTTARNSSKPYTAYLCELKLQDRKNYNKQQVTEVEVRYTPGARPSRHCTGTWLL
jgi:hypothetical protein